MVDKIENVSLTSSVAKHRMLRWIFHSNQKIRAIKNFSWNITQAVTGHVREYQPHWTCVSPGRNNPNKSHAKEVLQQLKGNISIPLRFVRIFATDYVRIKTTTKITVQSTYNLLLTFFNKSNLLFDFHVHSCLCWLQCH